MSQHLQDHPAVRAGRLRVQQMLEQQMGPQDFGSSGDTLGGEGIDRAAAVPGRSSGKK